MRRILRRKFFERPALKVAPDLLGKFLCVKSPLGVQDAKCLMITEVEAYGGPKDKASHAFRGRTKRNEPMFGEAGRWYVYFTYGMHWMLNIVTGSKDYPAAVLIRGVADFSPQSVIKRETSKANIFQDLASATARARGIFQQKNIRVLKNVAPRRLSGPAKLTKFLKIDKRFNAKKADKKTGLWIEDCGVKIKKSQIKRIPRIGVDYAREWAKKPYRFLLKF
ncbi:MAG: DNA-3-methyladenine glycosylase [bacterium]|nr:DNA-3-methyladenine glycosylase [bacterium]